MQLKFFKFKKMLLPTVLCPDITKKFFRIREKALTLS